MKEFIRRCSRTKDDLVQLIIGLTLITAAIAIAVLDVVSIVMGTVSPNEHAPFVLAIGLGAIGGITLYTLDRLVELHDHRRSRRRDDEPPDLG